MDTWLLIERHCNKFDSDVHWLHARCQAANTINLTWKNVEMTVRVNYYLMDWMDVDELREIAPNVFLGRFYERGPCPKLKGYFVLRRAGCD